ncbi:hypothetical protein Curi_c06850 [Gottschalkia acidurici 9a]|uniref:Uncharacterized protein n=1 Tax=Gottschalkia acidurici (strain ATCC 7906 / DSM 604 / BCRC 14475 / CIP 104303 / KCTC 5404 / NCIMB 10678 / 9a) TaxID=1128398 RepID=K0AV72_GOTA9|nr:hypothetical protein [Gottschalkia acidurici]AFS77758.1 hypothetical protein Curi_c06850 [Gottschalkia acidurici 9a]
MALETSAGFEEEFDALSYDCEEGDDYITSDDCIESENCGECGRTNFSLLFFFLLLVIIFNQGGFSMHESHESLLFFFLILVVLFNIF